MLFMSAPNLSSKLMVVLDVYGECVWIEFGSVGFRQGSELTLIPNMMYLPRVQANTQMKSEAYKPKVDTIKGKKGESGS